MNNEDINPNYKGRFLRNIMDDYALETLKFDEGTVLIQEAVGRTKVYFQLGFDYTYYNESRMSLTRSRNEFMEILLGSAVDSMGRPMPDFQKFCLAQHVKVPTDGELEWYESLNVV